ncbi:MAG: alkaline phosphatase PhoX [Lysobacterales bacterium]
MLNRRHFLQSSAGLATALAAGSANTQSGFLKASADQATGLHLLSLPDGFRYHSLGWRGDPLSDGTATPARHDGMAVVHADDSEFVLVRNHEVTGDSGAFALSDQAYDPAATGGTTTLRLNADDASLIDASASLTGTLTNCCGGPTPWGTWLSCEEDCVDPGLVINGRAIGLKEKHGFVFEVPADGVSNAKPIKDMGQFGHEAVAIDPATSAAYLTEDRHVAAGFYRFLPADPNDLHKGGRLQMMRVAGRENMVREVPEREFDVLWVDIDDPERGHVNNDHQDRAGVLSQGMAAGGTAFTRLEGCWYSDNKVYFSSTDGGDAGQGQIFVLDIPNQTVRKLYESPNRQTLDRPDNLTVAPNGAVVICEDGSRPGQMLLGLTRSGELKPIAQNTVKLNGEKNGFSGNFMGSEWCGACFSPDGKWLFANIQKPGITVAITGPWDEYLA